MKAKVKIDLNERRQKPSVNAPSDHYYRKGDIVEITDIVNGDKINENSLWFRLNNGNYVWSGGVEGVEDVIVSDVSSDNRDERPNLYKIIKLSSEVVLGTGKGITVAVLDSGIDINHPALQNQVSGKMHNFIKNEHIVKNGHGTLVAGIIAGSGDGFEGLAPEARLLDYRVIANDNYVNQEGLIKALEQIYSDITSNKIFVDIINLSLDVDSDSFEEVKALVLRLSELGVVIVVAGGEMGYKNFNMDFTNVVKVGIYADNKPKKSSFDVLIKNQRVFSTAISSGGKENCYGYLSDSSAFAAFISGIIAKYFSANMILREDRLPTALKLIKNINLKN